MSYPLDFANVHLEFTDDKSKKFYNASLVGNAEGKAIVVKRWGKIGVIGEMKVESFPTLAKAEKEYESIVSSKLRKGYERQRGDTKQITNETAFRMAIGPAVWPKLPPGPLVHIVPDMDVSGRRELDPARFSEDGKYLGEPAARVFSKTEIAAARERERQAEQAEAVKAYANNSNFGRF